MNHRSFARTVSLLAAAMLLASCASSPSSRYYVLSASPGSSQASSAGASPLRLASVRMSEVTDRPQVVYRTGATTVELREYDRWAEPIDQMVMRVLRQDLDAHAARRAGPAEPARLFVVIDEFMPARDGTVRLTGRWWTLPANDAAAQPTPRPFELDARTAGSDVEDAVAAMSALIGKLAEAILRG